jgi:hypothetical protein
MYKWHKSRRKYKSKHLRRCWHTVITTMSRLRGPAFKDFTKQRTRSRIWTIYREWSINSSTNVKEAFKSIGFRGHVVALEHYLETLVPDSSTPSLHNLIKLLRIIIYVYYKRNIVLLHYHVKCFNNSLLRLKIPQNNDLD